LVERLRRDARPIVSVVAPAGFGKTTLLSQWAERNGQAFARSRELALLEG
jgi:ATP/maltotriose-dependent transcriptional regulator MalT